MERQSAQWTPSPSSSPAVPNSELAASSGGTGPEQRRISFDNLALSVPVVQGSNPTAADYGMSTRNEENLQARHQKQQQSGPSQPLSVSLPSSLQQQQQQHLPQLSGINSKHEGNVNITTANYNNNRNINNTTNNKNSYNPGGKSNKNSNTQFRTQDYYPPHSAATTMATPPPPPHHHQHHHQQTTSSTATTTVGATQTNAGDKTFCPIVDRIMGLYTVPYHSTHSLHVGTWAPSSSRHPPMDGGLRAQHQHAGFHHGHLHHPQQQQQQQSIAPYPSSSSSSPTPYYSRSPSLQPQQAGVVYQRHPQQHHHHVHQQPAQFTLGGTAPAPAPAPLPTGGGGYHYVAPAPAGSGGPTGDVSGPCGMGIRQNGPMQQRVAPFPAGQPIGFHSHGAHMTPVYSSGHGMQYQHSDPSRSIVMRGGMQIKQEEPPMKDSASRDSGDEVRISKKGKRMRKYAKRACLACKKAHTSCSDERPCKRCVHRGIECVDVDSSKPAAKEKAKESKKAESTAESEKETPPSMSKEKERGIGLNIDCNRRDTDTNPSNSSDGDGDKTPSGDISSSPISPVPSSVSLSGRTTPSPSLPASSSFNEDSVSNSNTSSSNNNNNSSDCDGDCIRCVGAVYGSEGVEEAFPHLSAANLRSNSGSCGTLKNVSSTDSLRSMASSRPGDSNDGFCTEDSDIDDELSSCSSRSSKVMRYSRDHTSASQRLTNQQRRSFVPSNSSMTEITETGEIPVSRGFGIFRSFLTQCPLLMGLPQETIDDMLMEYTVLLPTILSSFDLASASIDKPDLQQFHTSAVSNFQTLLILRELNPGITSRLLDAYKVAIKIDLAHHQLQRQQESLKTQAQSKASPGSTKSECPQEKGEDEAEEEEEATEEQEAQEEEESSDGSCISHDEDGGTGCTSMNGTCEKQENMGIGKPEKEASVASQLDHMNGPIEATEPPPQTNAAVD